MTNRYSVVQRLLLALLFSLTLQTNSLADEQKNTVLGNWKTETTDEGFAKVTIRKVGDSIEGKITWLSEPTYPENDKQGMDGQLKIDRENPDKVLSSRPIIGLVLLRDFEYAGNGVWEKGTIYDPESGNTYKSTIKLSGPNKLKLRGYIGISLIGRTSKWTRLTE